MDKKQAQTLIKETFETAFDKGRFTNFIMALLDSVWVFETRLSTITAL